MSLPPGFLEELRERVPISRIVGPKVVWDQRKSNAAKGDWWAPCPFHHEKSPSFHVDDRKGFYYCFGCHAKGDALTFLREADGMSFIEAVKMMADEAGMAMPERDPAAARREDTRAGLVGVMEQAVQWFAMQLRSGAGSAAREYLSGRGLDADAWPQFDLGFAPDRRQGLFQALRDRGVDEDRIVEAGLAARPEGGGAPYDRFRGRIIYPIRDGRGRAIALGGRAMDPNARAKYLNSPETPLFDKGRTLYNIGPARAAVAKGQTLIVAEGYMDVIALVRAGFEGAVAPLGTAITEDQLGLLWRVSPEPVVMLDGDTAGQRAALRLLDLALPKTGPGQALRFATLPPGTDPDDLLRQGGVPAVKAALAAAQPLVDLLWRRETEGRNFDSPERRAALDHALRAAIAQIPDESTRGHYAQSLKRKRWAFFAEARPAPSPQSARRGKSGKAGRDGWRDRVPTMALPETRIQAAGLTEAAGDRRLEAVVLTLCARFPEIVSGLESRLERLDPEDADRGALIHDLLTGGDSPGAAACLAQLLKDAHVAAVVPLVGSSGKAAGIVGDVLDKLEARRATPNELARAEVEIQGAVDEGLTWRLGELARQRCAAEDNIPDDDEDDGDAEAAMSAKLSRMLETEAWKKPR